MNKETIKKYLVISLLIIEIFTVSLTIKSYSNKSLIDEIKENIVDSSLFGMFVETDDNKYEKYNDTNTFPNSELYEFNEEESYCVDINDEVIDVMSFSDGKITITSGKTSYCYMYFDKIKQLGSKLKSMNLTGLSEDLVGGLYRFQGTTADNYICFGTTDKDTCVGNTDAYMYRIIGINENNQLKLIKKEALNEGMQWYTDNTTNRGWDSSIIYTNINGNSFYNNTTYVPIGWKSKIAVTEWKYGQVSNTSRTASELYEIENAWTNIVNAKIGLIYAYDYAYGITGDNNCYYSGEYETCKTSWMHLLNNDPEAPIGREWTISRNTRTSSNQSYASYDILADGYINVHSFTTTNSVRPVFFLNSDETYISGSGTIDDPIIIGAPEESPYAGERIKYIQTTGLNTVSLEGGLYRYQGTNSDNYICFGTIDKDTCVGNTDAYMYRIMGINENNQLKLIKKEALNEHMQWYSDNTTDITWPQSTIYSSINGDSFLNNTTYVPDDTWKSKIAETEWKYGDHKKEVIGSELYTLENAWTDIEKGKIGLIYDYDYVYGLKGTNKCYSTSAGTTCKTSWLHLSNNDTTAPNANERTMTRYGVSTTSYYIWYINENGVLAFNGASGYMSIRPVFFLNANVEFNGGTGTITDPFLIK